MTTAATLLTETPIPTGKPAAAGIGAFAWSSFAMSNASPFAMPDASPFASLLAEGNFVQAPGMVPVENGGIPNPAILFSADQVGAALDGEDGPADPAFNVIPLFDSTSLSTPAPVTPVPVPGLGVTTPVPNGASSDAPTVAPTGDSSAASALAPAAGQTANLIPTLPTDPPQTTPAQTASGQQDPAHGKADGHAVGPQPALKGVTAADVMAEIAQLDPGPTDASVRAAPATPAGTPASPVGNPATPAGNPPPPPDPSIAKAAPALTVAAASSNGDGQAAPEGEAPDPRVTSQIVQSAAPRPSSQERATAVRAAAKPTTGLGSALSGDVALAAMAVETPKPRMNRPTVTKPVAATTANAGQGVSETPANPNNGTTAVQPLTQPASPVRPQLQTGQGTQPSVPPGLILDPMSLGADVAESPSAPRAALDARIDPPQPMAQPLRVGEAAAQTDRPTAMPTPAPTAPPTAPPAEQVALQLRHAVAKGVDKINIQLSPASLGTIDVTLEVTAGSRVVVQVIADRADTLELLRADARGLERALQEAGLRTDPGSLNFNLRGDGDGASHKNSTAHNDLDDGAPAGDLEDDRDLDAESETPETPARQASNQALDIEV